MKSKLKMKKKQSLAVTNRRGRYMHQSVDTTNTTNFGMNFNTLTAGSVDSRNENELPESFGITL